MLQEIRLCKQYKIHLEDQKKYLLREPLLDPVISVDNIIIGKGKRGFLTKNLQRWYNKLEV